MLIMGGLGLLLIFLFLPRRRKSDLAERDKTPPRIRQRTQHSAFLFGRGIHAG